MEKNQALTCTSCKSVLINSRGAARFICPNCTKTELIRCANCRQIAAKYICPDCGFTGPN